ncbi:MAG: ABC-three component system protein [Balneolaceae bacterium]
MSEGVTQTGNTAANDIVGRDKITYSGNPSPISNLLEQFISGDKTVDTIHEELEYFRKRINSDIKGLDGKLKEPKYSKKTLSNAKIAKEKYVKNLERHIHSESAQKIHIHLLSDAFSKFNNLITPNIENLSEGEVLEKVEKEIVVHIMELMSKNVLDFNNLTATGVVFFLTGNCHLEWE